MHMLRKCNTPEMKARTRQDIHSTVKAIYEQAYYPKVTPPPFKIETKIPHSPSKPQPQYIAKDDFELLIVLLLSHPHIHLT